jgi:branched-chain amino acid transport system permease protein
MQILVNGLISGLSLALLAASFSLVYVPTRVFYIALAGIYTMVPFVASTALQSGVPLYGALGLAVMSGVILSICCEKFNHGPLEKRGAPSGAHMISSLGIYILLSQVTAILWGNESKVLRTGVDNVSTIGDIVLTQSQLLTIAVSCVVLASYYLCLHFSRTGILFRAMSSNSEEFVLRGHNLPAMRLVSFAASGAFCAVSSLLVAYDIGFDPHGGLSAVLLAVVAVIVGGKQSFGGPLAGAILLSIARSLVIWCLSAQWAEAFTFAILALVLMVCPNGLLSAKMRMEAVS